MDDQTGFIALLRGVNVGGHNRVPMAELRELCAGLGWRDVRSYIASGNLAFTASGRRADLEAGLERGIQDRFGLSIAVVVRSAADWAACIDGNPFPGASGTEPNRVALVLSKSPPLPGAMEGLRERAADGERVERVRDAMWIHYAGGTGRSKLSPAALERLVGSPVTARNWRTVLRLGEMVRAADEERET